MIVHVTSGERGYALHATLVLVFLLATLALATWTLVSIEERRSAALEAELVHLYDADGSLRVAAAHVAETPRGRELEALPAELLDKEVEARPSGKDVWRLSASSGGGRSASAVTATVEKRGNLWVLTGYSRAEPAVGGGSR